MSGISGAAGRSSAVMTVSSPSAALGRRGFAARSTGAVLPAGLGAGLVADLNMGLAMALAPALAAGLAMAIPPVGCCGWRRSGRHHRCCGGGTAHRARNIANNRTSEPIRENMNIQDIPESDPTAEPRIGAAAAALAQEAPEIPLDFVAALFGNAVP